MDDQGSNKLFIGLVIGIAVVSLVACSMGAGEPNYSSEIGNDTQRELGPDQYDTGRP